MNIVFEMPLMIIAEKPLKMIKADDSYSVSTVNTKPKTRRISIGDEEYEVEMYEGLNDLFDNN